MATDEKIRIDKWLWSIRFFKSRSIASDACTGGKVKINDIAAKASSLVKIGDKITCKKEHINYELIVKAIIGKRVSAPIAITCYDNITPEAELNKFEQWFVGKAPTEVRDRGSGRPTKRDRRDIDEFKDRIFDEDDFIE
ncbi:MAG TPA: RNA-binding S4 domain-containing protein [Saprospiraceae bacterium]|nr:RNA-binding S4 domain-containing protein [Saprospiraceae bacterium]